VHIELKKSGMAVNSFTRSLFDPLPAKIIILVVVGIGHAIREFESGQKKVVKFDGLLEEGKLIKRTRTFRDDMCYNKSESWRRVKSTWSNQGDVRKAVMQKILAKQIKRLTRNTSVQSLNSGPVKDPFANNLDDLPISELEDSQSRSEIVKKPQARENSKVNYPMPRFHIPSN
jgi:hypothetical protein